MLAKIVLKTAENKKLSRLVIYLTKQTITLKLQKLKINLLTIVMTDKYIDN